MKFVDYKIVGYLLIYKTVNWMDKDIKCILLTADLSLCFAIKTI